MSTSKLDKKWHFAETELEIDVTEFEFHLWRLFYGFIQWQESCEKYVCGNDLNAYDIALLHVIRIQEKPKTVLEIGKYLNRDDPDIIKYSLSKFVNKGLVKKRRSSNKWDISLYYQITKKGIENTSKYSDARRDILVGLYEEFKLNLTDITNTLVKVKEIYDEASHRVSQEGDCSFNLEPSMRKKQTDKGWHLAQTDKEAELTEFEFNFWRTFASFLQWQEDCQNYTSHDGLHSHHLVLLHLVRMNDRPKSIYELSRLLNRGDPTKIQSIINRLVKIGLVEKLKGYDGKGQYLSYKITKEGVANTTKNRDARRRVLMELFCDSKLDFSHSAESLIALKGIYEESIRLATSYKS